MLKAISCFILFLVSSIAQAEVRVVFIEARGYGGRPIELEKNGRFSHVAVSYKGQWLQSLPKNGVELVSYADIVKTGKVVMLKSTSYFEPSQEFVDAVLGQPFEMQFSWESDYYYCSKLVAKTLDLIPLPMHFDTRVWPPSFQKYQGLLGLSPDDVYAQLLEKGFVHVSGQRNKL